MCCQTYLPGRRLEQPGVVFCKTDYAADFIRSGHNGHPCVLVTHESDYPVWPELACQMPDNILHWFGVNAPPDLHRVTPIPLGIASPGYSFGDQDVLQAVCRMNIQPTRTAIALFARSTHPSRNQDYGNCDWITDMRYDHHEAKPYDYMTYLKYLADHRFVLCPRGNGVDSHRLWETLYLGRQPILEPLPQYSTFLPVRSEILAPAYWHHRIRKALYGSVCDPHHAAAAGR